MLLLSGLIGLQMLCSGSMTLWQGVVWGAAAVCLCLAATVPFDSLLWGCWLWPEGEVLWFNTVLNKSSDWGTMPWHWYWTSALPRALLGSYLLFPIGLLLDPRSRAPGIAALGFVALYSALPHKELRFLLPVFPFFNLISAAGLAKLQLMAFPASKDDRRRPSVLGKGALLGATVAAVAGAALSLVFLRASQLNYPGGVALHRLHKEHEECAPGLVHIGTLAAMTGVTRYGQLGGAWRYSKMEGIPVDDMHSHGFSCLLSSEAHVPGFEVLEQIDGFQRLALAWRPAQLLRAIATATLPITWHTEPKLFLLKSVP